MQKLLISLINFYQTYLSFDRGILAILAPGGACKFEVRCSEYTKQMIAEYGVIKGLGFGVIRLWRCR